MRVHFGQFTLDTDSRRLQCGEADRHLSTKGFDLLCLLVQNRPRALSKAELFDRLWPATFVSDATLTSLVAEVRSALGESARSAQFVRTVHRHGYAFTGAATDLLPPPPARWWVVWEWGERALADGEHLLGRDSGVAVWLESPTVSRHHAKVSVNEAAATVEDLGSKNGTYLRGERVLAPTALEDGDELRLGSVVVRLRRVMPAMSTDPVDA